MKLLSTLLIVLLIGSTACHKKRNKGPITGDYLIVGWTGGFAGFSVHNYFLIGQGKVMKDVAKWNTLPDDISQFSFTEPTRASLYDSVKELLTTIPPELLARNNQDIGPTPGADMGFTDIRTSINGKTYRWAFAPDQSTSSPAVREFYTKANRVFQ